jgi:hypothetical protein
MPWGTPGSGQETISEGHQDGDADLTEGQSLLVIFYRVAAILRIPSSHIEGWKSCQSFRLSTIDIPPAQPAGKLPSSRLFLCCFSVRKD